MLSRMGPRQREGTAHPERYLVKRRPDRTPFEKKSLFPVAGIEDEPAFPARSIRLVARNGHELSEISPQPGGRCFRIEDPQDRMVNEEIAVLDWGCSFFRPCR